MCWGATRRYLLLFTLAPLFNMHYLYLLKSVATEEIYIGSTNDLRKRFRLHNEGRCRSTKSKRPWKLIYYEAYGIEKLARLREKRLKQHGNAKRELKRRIGLIRDKKSGVG